MGVSAAVAWDRSFLQVANGTPAGEVLSQSLAEMWLWVKTNGTILG